MFERIAIQYLRQWAKKEDRKPLVLRGARQVGKTTLVKLFAKEFDTYIYMNLEEKEYAELFATDYSFEDLLAGIYLKANKPLDFGKRTLIFIDEIQNEPKAVQTLRYFYEKHPEIYVIAAGSLLESLMGRHISFPVGRVEYMTLHPCTFVEFLRAMGQKLMADSIENMSLPASLHLSAMEWFKKYMIVGGLPEAVANYAKYMDIVPNYPGVYVRHTILNKDDDPMSFDPDNTQFTVTTRDDGTQIWQSFMRLWASYKKSSYICIYKDEASYIADPNDFVAIIKLSFYRKPDVSLSTLKFGLASSVKQTNGSAFNSSKPRFENGAEVLTLPYVCTTEEITDNGVLKVKFPVATSMFEVREKTFGSNEEDAAKNWKGTQESNAGDRGTVIYGPGNTSTTEISIPVKYEEGIIKVYSIYVYCDYLKNLLTERYT